MDCFFFVVIVEIFPLRKFNARRHKAHDIMAIVIEINRNPSSWRRRKKKQGHLLSHTKRK